MEHQEKVDLILVVDIGTTIHILGVSLDIENYCTLR